MQEITTWLPGRIEAAETAFASTGELVGAPSSGPWWRTASTRSARAQADPGWPAWYADYLVRRAGRRELSL